MDGKISKFPEYSTVNKINKRSEKPEKRGKIDRLRFDGQDSHSRMNATEITMGILTVVGRILSQIFDVTIVSNVFLIWNEPFSLSSSIREHFLSVETENN